MDVPEWGLASPGMTSHVLGLGQAMLGGCPGAQLCLVWVDVQGWGWPFDWTNIREWDVPVCGRLNDADVAPPTDVHDVTPAAADAIVALDVKCINITLSIDYQLYF